MCLSLTIEINKRLFSYVKGSGNINDFWVSQIVQNTKSASVEIDILSY